MFSHIMIGTNDLDRAKTFYDKLLGTLGVPPARVDGHRIFYMTPTGVFSVTQPIDGEPATCANGMTIGFNAKTSEDADAWHAAGHRSGRRHLRRAAGGCAKAPPARCIWLICATRTVTSSAPCIGCSVGQMQERPRIPPGPFQYRA